MTIILGIDPGSRITGYGLIKKPVKKSNTSIAAVFVPLQMLN